MELFFRDGESAGDFKPEAVEKGAASIMRKFACYRCGGAGSSDAWKFTGYTCYRCNGRGHEFRNVRIFTADKLAALIEAQAKRDAKKVKAAQARDAKKAREAEATAAKFESDNAELIAKARPYVERSDFVADVLRQGAKFGALSDGQRAALARVVDAMATADARKAGSAHVGALGERTTLEGLRVVSVASFPSSFGYDQSYCIVAMRAPCGASVVYKGARTYGLGKGDTVNVAATIKAHGDYKGEAQTQIQRPKFEIVEKGESAY